MPVRKPGQVRGLGQRLQEFRTRKNLTRRQFGALIGVTDTSIRNWEKEQKCPRSDYVVLICTTFSVSADWLLGLRQ